MKRPVIIILLAALMLVPGCQWDPGQDHRTVPVQTQPKAERPQPSYEVDLLAVGDIMLARGVDWYAQKYGSDHLFKAVKDQIQSADVAMGNLESPLSDRGKALPGKGIAFRARPERADLLYDTGFDVLSLANNHSLDYDSDGFVDTIDLLQGKGIRTVGGGKNIIEARKPAIVEKNGLKIGFLGYTIYADIIYDTYYRRSFRATETLSGVAPMVKEIMIEDIAALEPQVDYTVVTLHWGTEYNRAPDQDQIMLGRELIDSGADLIVGHHPHIIQGFEKYHNGLIAYSLGNFVFDQNWAEYTRKGLMLNVKFTKKGMQNMNAVPVYIENGQPSPMPGTEGEALLQDLKNRTEILGTPATVKGNRLEL